MSAPPTFETFQKELTRLVESFGQRVAELKRPSYVEAQLRDDFLNPFFRALGWDMENRAGLIQQKRDVEIESRTLISGRQKRADYLFRVAGRDRFVCEAKKPAEELHARYAFQAKRYAWNKDLPIAVLTDFEETKVYVVGGKPRLDEPHIGEMKSWSFREYPLVAREIWDLLSYDRVAAGGIERLLESLPKSPARKGKARQQWLIKPDRSRALDTAFLEFLDEARRALASDLYKHNDHEDLLQDNRLNEAVQRILDRILFIRICEDRDIDTGQLLHSIVETWRKNTGSEAGLRPRQRILDPLRDEPPAYEGAHGIKAPADSLWRLIIRHFRALDHRPPTHVPFFNGNLFKPHFSESLIVGDEWLADFIGELSDDETPYLFNAIPVEILGSVYERFLGKVVRPHGMGVTIEEKPEVRKAGGVYYTPRYIVDYIVEQTVGRLLDEISGPAEAVPSPADRVSANPPASASRTLKEFEKRTSTLRILDPACGSGSFLIRAYERVCEHWQSRLTASLRETAATAGSSRGDETPSEKVDQSLLTSPPTDEKKAALAAWKKKHRPFCWVDDITGDVHLTVDLKRRVLTRNIYGVDLDSAAVEVTQLSLYLKMLENENRTTLERERELFAEAVALLPPLQDNIKCGNSLIASDFSMMPEDLVRVRAFDWPVQFRDIMKAGGFDAVIGNPPYIRIQRIAESESNYLFRAYQSPTSKMDLSLIFLEKGLKLAKKTGRISFICTSQWLAADYGKNLRKALSDGRLHQLVDFGSLPVFADASTYPSILVLCPTPAPHLTLKRVTSKTQLNLKGVAQAPSQAIPLSSLSGRPWTMGSLDIAAVARSRGQQCQPLSHFGKAYIGTKCGLNEAFVLTREEAREARIERNILYPYAYRGGEVDRFMPVEPDSVIIYPYERGKDGSAVLLSEETLKSKFPNAYAHLLKYKPQLRERQDSRRFYARGADWYRHLRAGTYNYVRPPKLALKGIALRCSVGLLPENTAFDGARCPCVILEDVGECSSKYFLALLNSALATVHLKAVCPPKLHGYIEFSARAVTAFPVRVIDLKNPTDKARHDKLVALVDKMLVLMPELRAATSGTEKAALQNAVTATDHQIDQLVYELYGLSPEEIALVESNA
jgi:hypothetical protein